MFRGILFGELFKSTIGLVLLLTLLIACENSLVDKTSPSITTFRATPPEIIAGQSSTVEWAVESNQPVSVKLNGSDHPSANSMVIAPSESTTYTLTAANSVEEVSKNITIKVNTLAEIPKGIYSLESASTSLCVDVPASSQLEAIDIALWDCHFNENQQWLIDKIDNTYTLTAQHSSKVLAGTKNSKIQQYDLQNSDNHSWYIINVNVSANTNATEGYKLISENSNTCLDLDATNNLILSTCTDSATQVFKLKKNLANSTSPIGTSLHSGQWSEKIDFPIVPVAASLLPNNKVLMWSSFDAQRFGGRNGYTQTALFDLSSGQTTQQEITLGHDMFCPGISMLADGQILVNGGSDNYKTSLYSYSNNQWQEGSDMNIGRGYHSTVTLNNGDVFTLGGSWGSPTPTAPEKIGELWNSTTQQWKALTGAGTTPLIEANDPEYDAHPQIYTAPNGNVFLAGPTPNLAWYNPYDPQGVGSVVSAGKRSDDVHSQVGITAMFDVGKILKAGGASRYTANAAASSKSYVIDINNPDNVAVTKVSPMNYPRAFASSVVLPDGQVLVTGGATVAKIFDDSTAVKTPELWNPETGNWRELAAHAIERTYHSVALLLPDATVLVAGGGLCGLCGLCGINHADGEIFSPPYLFDAAGNPANRPEIISAPLRLNYNQNFNVTTSTEVTDFTLVRLSSITHGVNTDQRFIKLKGVVDESGSYTLKAPEANIAPPGYWMLFALDSDGVPSVAAMVNLAEAN